MLKSLVKKFIPKTLLLTYHKSLAVMANVVYGFPSRQLIVVGVTGTKGKSSTAVMIVRILEEAGYKVGSTNTIFFEIADKEWPNTTKQGMPGRFKLQKLLRQMTKAGCTHAVIEVTSEGIAQSRQWGIAFDVAVFTNLSPEHIESHGSYEKYRLAKAAIFKSLHQSYRKVFNGQAVKKIIIVNGAEPEADYFFQFPADAKYKVTDQGEVINLQLPGEFMRTNALLALAAGRALGIKTEVCIRALEKIPEIPGRAQVINPTPGFKVIIDYAHEPRSFTAILKTGRELAGEKKLIALFGTTGGGRDAGKRPTLAKIAASTADYMIITNEDPYNDDPQQLIDQVAAGVTAAGRWREGENWWRIIDRREAITKALSLAQAGDVVLVLGKGSERVMATKGGLIPWSDETVVREYLSTV